MERNCVLKELYEMRWTNDGDSQTNYLMYGSHILHKFIARSPPPDLSICLLHLHFKKDVFLC